MPFRQKRELVDFSYMTEKEFAKLLQKYLDGNATPDEQASIEKWYSFLMSRDQLSNDNDGKLRDLYWKNIFSGISQKKTFLPWPGIAIAAVITFVVISFAYLTTSVLLKEKEQFSENFTSSLEKFVNDGRENQLITLHDGSEVLLYPGSSLEFPKSFHVNERKVFLTGEGFFKVSHNAEKPFYVFANEIVTRVLGTSFTVRAFPEDRDITVAVKTGSVSVSKKKKINSVLKDEGIILMPNQQAVYSRNSDKVVRMLVRNPEVILPKEEVKKIIRFEGAPVSEIFQALEKMYGVEIVFNQKAFSTCSLTTSGSGQSLYQTLDIICEAIGATYIVEDIQVKINGIGCN